ncbi:hypothetical protein B0H17DRAFT_941885 [Mycena rosella]|uniref:Uncharacterized protein n=1 Tax=Mycena rosella TaxID=1033263 RepID=A0AAD7D9B1_MYCRO|nr:hypothetical protein B0H17DRAFT_941885 [Mycena rosella]
MKCINIAALFYVLFTAHAVSGQCQDGQCVTLFSGSGCQGEITEFIPSCNNNCIQFNSSNSIFTLGSLIHGTDCEAFSDSNCQNQMVNTGNHIVGTCANAPGTNSYKCFFDC